MDTIKNIVVIGSGNVAFHLIKAFSHKRLNILQILGRNKDATSELAETFNLPYITDPNKLNREADLYILAVQDDQVRQAALSLSLKNQLLVHTSGFTPMNVLKGASTKSGVIWLLQTLTKGHNTDYRKIPVFVEGSDPETAKELAVLASRISETVTVTDSDTRRQVHLAAVIASNLSNHLYTIAADILEKEGISFDVLRPLIMETAQKAMHHHPMKSQTGPAARKDMKVIAEQLEMLKDEPAFREIYRLITENIILHHNNPDEKL